MEEFIASAGAAYVFEEVKSRQACGGAKSGAASSISAWVIRTSRRPRTWVEKINGDDRQNSAPTAIRRQREYRGCAGRKPAYTRAARREAQSRHGRSSATLGSKEGFANVARQESPRRAT